MHLGAAADLSHEFIVMLAIEIDPLPNVGKVQNLIDGVLPAVIDELHHQLVVGNAEFAEPAESGTRVHQERKQHPSLRIEDVFAVEFGRVRLVDLRHHSVR